MNVIRDFALEGHFFAIGRLIRNTSKRTNAQISQLGRILILKGLFHVIFKRLLRFPDTNKLHGKVMRPVMLSTNPDPNRGSHTICITGICLSW